MSKEEKSLSVLGNLNVPEGQGQHSRSSESSYRRQHPEVSAVPSNYYPTLYRKFNLRKQSTIPTTPPLVSPCNDFEERTSKFHILITCYYPDLGSASDWSCCEGNLLQPIRSTTQFLIVTRHQYGVYSLAPQRHYERKPVWGCFLRLSKIQKTLNSLAPQATHLHY